MKKRLFSIALCLMLFLSLCVTAHAADGVYLIDEPGLLTQDEAETLESRAAELTGRYGIGVYIAVVDDFTDYASDCETASEEIYLANGFGVGSEQNGILLMLSMADRDYDLCAYGTDAHLAFTDYGKERLEEEFLDDFRYDDWYTGFEDYLHRHTEHRPLSRQLRHPPPRRRFRGGAAAHVRHVQTRPAP